MRIQNLIRNWKCCSMVGCMLTWISRCHYENSPQSCGHSWPQRLADSSSHPGAWFQELSSHRIQLGMKQKPRKYLLWNKEGWGWVSGGVHHLGARTHLFLIRSVVQNSLSPPAWDSSLPVQWKLLWVRTKPGTATLQLCVYVSV